MIQAETQPRAAASTQRDLFDDVWSLFCSTRLALTLILSIALACLAGALIAQVPGEVLRSAEATRTWVERIRPRYGIWTDLLQLSGLFSVFETLWFRGLLTLLTVNTLVCTLNRLPTIYRQVFGAPAWPADGLFERGQPRAIARLVDQPIEAAERRVQQTLRSGGYRALVNSQEQVSYLYADRFRLARFGTVLTHAALLLVFAAAVVSGPLGYFEESGFAVPIGSSREVGHGTALTVRVDDFADEYQPDGRPKDYRSDLTLFEHGREVARQTIRVNEPLIYNGVRFHQAYYGQAAIVTVGDQRGNQLFRDAVALTYRSNDGQRPVGYFRLPGVDAGQDLQIYLVGPASGGDPMLRAGELLVEAYRGDARNPTYRLTLTQRQPLALASLQIQFEREIPFTGLRVVRDPGAMVVWVASAMLILGLVLAFYFPHRKVWARIQREAGGLEVAVVGAGKELAGEVERLARRIDPHAAVVAAPTPAARPACPRAAPAGPHQQIRGKSRGR